MIRPDRFRYEQFCRHLEAIDDVLARFAAAHGFEVQKNLHRQPSRDLRRTGPPMHDAIEPHTEFIGIHLDGYWRMMDWQEDLPHKVGVAAYYRPVHGKRLYKRVTIVEHQPFLVIQENLVQLLNTSLNTLESWRPPVVSQEDPDAASQGWQRTLS